MDVLAVIAAYNEGDIIGATVGDLVSQGIAVHLIDHGSSDDTVAEAERHGSRVTVERLPPSRDFPWAELLRKKQQIAARHPGRSIIHADADELREAPWPDARFVDALGEADAGGYNAVDFAVLNFRPLTEAPWTPGGDLRAAFPAFEWGDDFDRLQIRCWRQPPGGVNLASTGGHEARFDGRRVYPLRFLLRHYPVRGQAHGKRKVFAERVGRFLDEERAHGWHVQYNGLEPGARFVREAASLQRFDAVATRRLLLLREATRAAELAVEAVELREAHHASVAESARLTASLADERRQRAALEETLAATRAALEGRLAATRVALEETLAATRATHEETLAVTRATHEEALAATHAALDAERGAAAELRTALATVEERLDALLTSRSWTWAAPARFAWELLRARRR